jgi:hypothetical protein
MLGHLTIEKCTQKREASRGHDNRYGEGGNNGKPNGNSLAAQSEHPAGKDFTPPLDKPKGEYRATHPHSG